MSKVDESVYHKVLGHFKSDLEEAEKHKQKSIEFKKKHKGIEISEIEEGLKKNATGNLRKKKRSRRKR